MTEVNFLQSVFPIFQVVKSPSTSSGRIGFLGTCFYCTVAGVNLFVSAKHFLPATEKDSKGMFLIAPTGNEGGRRLELQAVSVHHLKSDFGFFIPVGEMKDVAQREFRPFTVSDRVVGCGYDVVSFGFPLTKSRYEAPNRYTGLVDFMLFKGYVHSVWKDANPQKFQQVYALSFPSLPGMSGAPLLAVIDGSLCAIGVMHERRHLDKTLTASNEFTENGKTVIEKEYMGYDVGIASDCQPFLDIATLLVEISEQKKD